MSSLYHSSCTTVSPPVFRPKLPLASQQSFDSRIPKLTRVSPEVEAVSRTIYLNFAPRSISLFSEAELCSSNVGTIRIFTLHGAFFFRLHSSAIPETIQVEGVPNVIFDHGLDDEMSPPSANRKAKVRQRVSMFSCFKCIPQGRPRSYPQSQSQSSKIFELELSPILEDVPSLSGATPFFLPEDVLASEGIDSSVQKDALPYDSSDSSYGELLEVSVRKVDNCSTHIPKLHGRRRLAAPLDPA